MSATDYKLGFSRGYDAAINLHCTGVTRNNSLSIKEVIFNDPATIVYWEDGTKTVVKCHNETFDEEKGLAMAIAKKAFDNKGNYNDVFKKYVPKKEEPFSLLADAIRSTFCKVK